MKRIGILSDTHGYWDDRYYKYFEECDEIWHAGDIGSVEVADKFQSFRPFRAVYGNIDSRDIRIMFPETLRFDCEGVDVMMKHIGGYPGRYDTSVREILRQDPPSLFISGHSHILKVMYDDKLHLLHINPGAAGLYGQQAVRTLIRVDLHDGGCSNLEVIELNK